MQLELVPVPTPPKSTPVRSNDPSRPFVGMYVKGMHKWFVDVDLESVVGAYLNEVDHGNGGFGYGAREIGSAHPLYFMSTGTANKTRVGTVSYNGNVRLDVVLA